MKKRINKNITNKIIMINIIIVYHYIILIHPNKKYNIEKIYKNK
jgi:hypothetical protein